MNSTSYPLTQAEMLALQGAMSAGHEESAYSYAPLPHDEPSHDAPTFAPLSRAVLSGTNAPCAPRGYVAPSSYVDEPDMDEDTDEDEPLREYARMKQGREMSPEYLPSMRNRASIRAELASMGCIWGE